MRDRLLATGLIGTTVAALCCFTPILVVLLSALGLAAVVEVLDYLLLPALALFVGIAVVALARRIRAARGRNGN